MLSQPASNSNLEILERFQSKVLRIITDARRYVPNVVIKRDLQVLTVRQEVRNYSVTYRQKGSTVIPTAWPNLYSKDQLTILGLSGIIPQIYQLDFNQYSAKSPETKISHL
jgi:predicted kinase